MSNINNRILCILNSDSVLSRKGLADYLKKPPNTLSNWLNKNRAIPADCIIPICQYLSVSVTWLLTGEDESADSSYLNADSPTITGEASRLFYTCSQLPDVIKEDCVELINAYSLLNVNGRRECLGFIKGYDAADLAI